MPDVVAKPLPMQDWAEGDPEVIRIRPGESPMEAKRRQGLPIRPRPKWVPVYTEPSPRQKCWETRCWDPAVESRTFPDGERVRLCHRHAHDFDVVEAEEMQEQAQDATAAHVPGSAPWSRAAHNLAGAPRNRPDRPSKTPQGRQEEYRKAKAARRAARASGAPVDAPAEADAGDDVVGDPDATAAGVGLVGAVDAHEVLPEADQPALPALPGGQVDAILD